MHSDFQRLTKLLAQFPVPPACPEIQDMVNNVSKRLGLPLEEARLAVDAFLMQRLCGALGIAPDDLIKPRDEAAAKRVVAALDAALSAARKAGVAA